jgi:purine-binding chemotaxis protein CheW
MTSNSSSTIPFIIFRLLGTQYAVRSDLVQQIEMVEQITPIPNARSFVDGLVFARGQVIPVVNLRARFGFERIPVDLKTRLMVVASNGRTVGLLIDSAREFVLLTEDVIQPPPDGMSGISGEYIAGIATVGDQLVLIVDIGAILNFGDIATAV